MQCGRSEKETKTFHERPLMFQKGPICFRKDLYVSKEPHMFEKETRMLPICCALKHNSEGFSSPYVEKAPYVEKQVPICGPYVSAAVVLALVVDWFPLYFRHGQNERSHSPGRCRNEKWKARVTKNAPYTCGNFHACAITRFQKPQQLGRVRTACSSIGTSRAQRAWHGNAQRPALLQAASCGWNRGKEDSIAVRRVRHGKEVGLQEWPLAGRATVPRVLYGIGLRMSLRRRTILSKS